MSPAAIEVVLYGKVDCPLCDEMKLVVEKVRKDVGFTLTIVDIERDPALLAAYGLDIPVLVINERKAFKHRLSEIDLRRRLRRAAE